MILLHGLHEDKFSTASKELKEWKFGEPFLLKTTKNKDFSFQMISWEN